MKDGTCDTATTLLWDINFGDGIYRHPTYLYAILFLATLTLLLWLLERRTPVAGGFNCF